MPLRAPYPSTVGLGALAFALLVCLVSCQPDFPPTLTTTPPPGSLYPSERYNNSVFHQDCIYDSESHCSCTSLWDSGCNCDGKDPAPSKDSTACDCAPLCREVWKPNLPLSTLTSNQCHIPQVRQYNVKVFLNSLDKVSMNVMPYFQRMKEVMGAAVSIELHYLVAYADLEAGTHNHGMPKILGDLMARCAMSLYPDPSVSLPYITCLSQSKGSTQTLSTALNCSKLHTQVKYPAIQTCATTITGIRLLQNDYSLTLRYRVDTVPRIFMDDRSFHAGAAATYEVYEAALCYVFANATSVFPWFIFYIMLAFIALIMLIFFTVKRWSHTPVMENIQSIFMWNHHAANEQVDMLLLLRSSGIGGDEFPMFGPDDDEEEQEEENQNNGENQDSNENDTAEGPENGRASRRRQNNRNRRGRDAQDAADEENEFDLETSSQRPLIDEDSDDEIEAARRARLALQRTHQGLERRVRDAPAQDDYQVEEERPSSAAAPGTASASSQYVHGDLFEDMPDYYRSSSDEESEL